MRLKKFLICEAIKRKLKSIIDLFVHHRLGSQMFHIPSATTIMLDSTRRQSHPGVHDVHLSNLVAPPAGPWRDAP